MRKSILIAVANVALAGLVYGCGESVPLKDARGGILSGTEVERQRYSSRRNPVLVGNGMETVGESSAAPTVTPVPREGVRSNVGMGGANGGGGAGVYGTTGGMGSGTGAGAGAGAAPGAGPGFGNGTAGTAAGTAGGTSPAGTNVPPGPTGGTSTGGGTTGGAPTGTGGTGTAGGATGGGQ